MASFKERMIIGVGVLFALAGRHHAARIENGSFPEHWINGTTEEEPALQVHLFSARTWIFRQSVLTHFEAPFLYLLAGEREALSLSGQALRERFRGLSSEHRPPRCIHDRHDGHDGQ